MMRYRAVLTGASGGIGRAIAAALAPHCEALVLVGRDPARLAESAAAAGPVARCVAADLATAEGRTAVELRASTFINNAGAGEFARLEAQSDESVARIIETNVTAPMQLTRRLLPELARQREAWIVNVGSIMGYLGYPGHAAYCASSSRCAASARRCAASWPTGRCACSTSRRATRTAMNGAAVCALNAELGVAMDEPAAVARELLALLRIRARAPARHARAPVRAPQPACPVSWTARCADSFRSSAGTRRPCRRKFQMKTASVARLLPCLLTVCAALDDDLKERSTNGPRSVPAARGCAGKGVRRAHQDRRRGLRAPCRARGAADLVRHHRRELRRARGGLGALSLAKDAKRRSSRRWKSIRARSTDRPTPASARSTTRCPLADRLRQRREGARAPAEGARDQSRGIDPNYFLGDFLYRKGDYDGAREALGKALKAPPRPGPRARRRGPAQGDRGAARRDALKSRYPRAACASFS